MSILEKVFGTKYFLAPAGYDPTIDPLPDQKKDRGGGGLGTWLMIGLMTLALAGVAWFTIWKLTGGGAVAEGEATAAAAAETGATAAPLEVVSVRPSRTPLVWPTIGVMSVTEATGAPVSTGATTATASPTPPALEGTRPATDTPLPTPRPPTQTPRVVYVNNGPGGPGPTQIVYVDAPTYTPQPTYTPLPTYTLPPVDTPTPTSTPTATATCTPPEPPVLPVGPYMVYLPLVAGGDGQAQGCAP